MVKVGLAHAGPGSYTPTVMATVNSPAVRRRSKLIVGLTNTSVVLFQRATWCAIGVTTLVVVTRIICFLVPKTTTLRTCTEKAELSALEMHNSLMLSRFVSCVAKGYHNKRLLKSLAVVKEP